MAVIESTAIAQSDTTPTRRTSWKDESDQYAPVPENEKVLSHGSTNNPFDSYHCNLQATAPTVPPVADVEAQYSRSIRPRFKHKAIACTTLTFMIVIWLFLIMGILLLTDNFYPTATRSYHMIKDMEIHMVDTKAAVDMLKNQVGKLYGYMDGYGFINGFGGMGSMNESVTEFAQ